MMAARAHAVVLLGLAAGVAGDCLIPRGVSRAEKCDFIRDEANADECELESVVDYLGLFYCYEVSQTAAYFILAAFVLWWCLLVLVLGTTADEYFCPALESLSDWLGLRQRVAAVTLLALGNGAPDIFSVQAALAQGETRLAIGALLGGCLIVTTVVVALVVLKSSEPVKAQGVLFRDAGFLLLATGLIFVVLLTEQVTLWQPLILLALYAAFVATVALAHHIPPLLAADRANWRAQRALVRGERAIRKLSTASATTSDAGSTATAGGGASLASAKPPRVSLPDLLPPPPVSPAALKGRRGSSMQNEEDADDRQTALLGESFNKMSGLTPQFPKPPGLGADLAAYTKWGEYGMAGRVLYVLEFPFRLARTLTIPAIFESAAQRESDGGWQDLDTAGGLEVGADRLLVSERAAIVLVALGCPTWVCIWLQAEVFDDDFETVVAIGRLELPVVVVVMLASLPLVAVAAVLTRGQRRPPAAMQRVYVVSAFVASVAWIDVVVGEVVSLLQAVGYVFDIPAGLLGQTALAWGNSFGDIFANIALARRGRAKMASEPGPPRPPLTLAALMIFS